MQDQYLFTVTFLLVSFLSFFPPRAKAESAELKAAKKALEDGAVLIDVRSPEEFAEGHAKDAINIPHTEIGSRLGELRQYKDKEIVLYCRSGHRSGLAKAELLENDFSHVINAGGLKEMQEISCINC